MKTNLVNASGDPATARVVVVGEAPGNQELVSGIGFVGPSGKILWGTAADCGFSRADCFVTNVVQSAPLGAGGNPTQTQIAEEWERLDSEMQSCEAAEVLFLIGGVALRRLAGWPSITDANAYILTREDLRPVEARRRVKIGEYKTSRVGKYQKGDAKYAWKRIPEMPVIPPNVKWIVPVYHPAAIMKTGFKLKPAFAAACIHVGELLRGQPLIEITSGEEHSKFVAIDIETPTPPNDWMIEQVGISTDLKTTTQVWDGVTADTLRHLFTSTYVLAFHNASFDIPRIEHAITQECKAEIWDTMYGAQLLNPDLPKGLGRVAPINLLLRPWKHLKDIEPNYYNKMDAFVTRKLAEAQHAIFKKTGQLEVFKAMMRGLPVLMRMHRRGIKVDSERRREWEEKLSARYRDLLDAWPRVDVDPASWQQIQKLLYVGLKLTKQYNKDGGLTTDAGAIKQLLSIHPEHDQLLKCLLDIREVSKNLSTYAKVELDENECVHPEYAPVDKDEKAEGGAGTGRITARNPSITNQKDEARCLFIPFNPDDCLAYADWSQAELRYDAWRSQDDALKEALKQPGGVPNFIMERIHVDRVRAKNLIYGKRNLAGARTIAKEIRRHGYTVKENEIQAQLDELARLFPKWTRYSLTLVNEGRTKRYVTNAFGRRRYFYDRKRAAAMVGFNAQSAVADMMWERLPALDSVTTLLCTVYDGVLFTAHKALIERDASRVKEVMEKPFPQVAPDFKVPVDIKIGLPGESWGDMDARYEEMKNEQT